MPHVFARSVKFRYQVQHLAWSHPHRVLLALFLGRQRDRVGKNEYIACIGTDLRPVEFAVLERRVANYGVIKIANNTPRSSGTPLPSSSRNQISCLSSTWN